jgi:hypothetical protein
MVPIYTQAVGTNSPSSISFNNIPQNFTDLQIAISLRVTNANDYYAPLFLGMGGVTSAYSDTILFGQNSSVTATRNSYGSPSGNVMIGYAAGNNATANTFNNLTAYIPNYTSATFKQFISDNAQENNSASSYLINLSSCLIRSTSPVTSLTFSANGTGFAQHSTFTLYGIRNS